MDQIAGTVTLKEGWRKVLLPALDYTKKNISQTIDYDEVC